MNQNMNQNNNQNSRIYLGVKSMAGRLIAPAEVATSARTGKQFVKFTIASDGDTKDAPTAFVQIVYGATGLAPYLGKGAIVNVEGKLYASAYIGKDGQAKVSLSLTAGLVKLFSRGDASAQPQPQAQAPQQQYTAPAQAQPVAPQYTPAPQPQAQPVAPQFAGTPAPMDEIPF